MALNTQKVIFDTFEEMLEEMPFDKISVTALSKRCGISSTTFYYHYQDIYALLNTWLRYIRDERCKDKQVPPEWKEETRTLLHACKAHPKVIYHLIHSLSREQTEQYLYAHADKVFHRYIMEKTGDRKLSDEKISTISMYCSFLFLGHVLKFLWDRMQADIDSSVEGLGQMVDAFIAGALDTL